VDTITLTWEQLEVLLDDFREWYECIWLGDTPLPNKWHQSAINYYLELMRADPCWPDRPPSVTMGG
jgi:hypothetical protein